jgi:hypothetical protein
VDPRRGNAQRHELDEIVMVALLALVSGAETCVDMALLRRFLRLPGGIPSHDTFSLVALLTLDGCIVTANAMHRQRATAEAILERGGDYVLAVKGNQKTLLEGIQLLLDDPDAVLDNVA